MPAVPKRAPAGLVRELRWRPRPPCVSPGTKGRLPDGIGQGWVESSLRMYARSPTTGERKKTSQGGVSITPKRLCLDHFEASAKKKKGVQKKSSLYTHQQMRRARKRLVASQPHLPRDIAAGGHCDIADAGLRPCTPLATRLAIARCASALLDDVLARPKCYDPTSVLLGARRQQRPGTSKGPGSISEAKTRVALVANVAVIVASLPFSTAATRKEVATERSRQQARLLQGAGTGRLGQGCAKPAPHHPSVFVSGCHPCAKPAPRVRRGRR